MKMLEQPIMPVIVGVILLIIEKLWPIVFQREKKRKAKKRKKK